jgi:hypothetical protein
MLMRLKPLRLLTHADKVHSALRLEGIYSQQLTSTQELYNQPTLLELQQVISWLQ